MIDVEGQTDRDASPGDVGERARDEASRRLGEVEVVEGEVEALLRGRDELAYVLGDLEGALAAVRQCSDLDCQA
jgi:hypothetical protein